MEKICKICGRKFEAKQEHFDICYECYTKQKQKQDKISALFIDEYFDAEGRLKKEIFIDIPEKIAHLLSQDGLKINQLREFYQIISKAYREGIRKGLKEVLPILWKCKPQLEYQRKRDIVPQSFVDFMNHHLNLAQKDIKHLEAFFQHFDAVVCYFPK
ncbi:MAG: type III-A CRISPR-associated protein Csm2 [Candidatus Omnitrophica bacterium 4484_70.1]|nr:MAG: type III-A CRISPR-associated protein Csm2 [Candidatus Omnitrophica bacterium 4484_70.1]